MKAKITKGKSFKAIIKYIFSPGEKDKSDRAEWIGGTLASDNPDGLIKEFAVVQRLKPELKNPSWHCSLTLPKGEYLSQNQWSDVVEDFMDKMKFDKHTPYAIVRHNDTELDHVHIVASRIPMVGPAWRDGRDVFRAIAATQELEKEYGLTQTPGYRKRESARATYRERKKAENSGVAPPKIQLQELIDEAVADSPTAPEFAQRLEDAGVIVRASIASTGKMHGFSFELDGLAFKGSKLGKAYGWGGLQKRGVTYDAERDAEGIERYRLPVSERPPRISEELEESTPTPTPIYIDIEKPEIDAEREEQYKAGQDKAEQTGEKLPTERLQELIDSAVVDNPTAPEFAQRLEDAGVVVRASVASTGRMSGFSFELDGEIFKGSSLGRAYGWGGLQKRGVVYDAARDAEDLEMYRLPVEERPPLKEEPEKSTPIYIEIEKPDQEVERERQRQIEAKLQEHPYMSLSEAEQWVEFDRMWSANSSKRQAAQEQERQRIRERAEALWAKVEAEREEEKERARREAAQGVDHSDEKPEIAVEPEPEQPRQEQSEPIPEVAQVPIEPSAYSKASIPEPDLQQQWVENLCYDLADLLDNEQVSEVKGKRRTVAWDSEQKRLTLRENKTQKVVLDAEWDEQEARWKDNGSTLSHAESDEISRTLDKWRADRDREQERERQQRSASKGLER